MAESAKHIELVKKIASYVNQLFQDLTSTAIELDLPESERRPPKVLGGFIPDMYYKFGDLIIIGEAKTDNDIDNFHTRQQVKSYVDEERTYHGKRIIILCTTLYSFPSMRNFITRYKRNEEIDDVEFHIIDEFAKTCKVI